MKAHDLAAASVLMTAAGLAYQRPTNYVLMRELVAIAEDLAGCSWEDQAAVRQVMPVSDLAELEAALRCG